MVSLSVSFIFPPVMSIRAIRPDTKKLGAALAKMQGLCMAGLKRERKQADKNIKSGVISDDIWIDSCQGLV